MKVESKEIVGKKITKILEERLTGKMSVGNAVRTHVMKLRCFQLKNVRKLLHSLLT